MVQVNTYRDTVVDRLYKGLQGLVQARQVTLINGSGRLTSPTTVDVDAITYTATKGIVLATGSTSRSLPGLEIGGRSSYERRSPGEVPARAIVLGGGVIGVEFASVWRSFGSDVTIIEALPRLLPNEDVACSQALERAFRRRGITVTVGARFGGVTQSDAGVVVSLEDGTQLEAELLLVAVGRGPNTEGMGFVEVGAAVDRGFVLANDRLHERARCLRCRRHCPRPAARAPRLRPRHFRRRGDCRTRSACHLRGGDPSGDLLRARKSRP